MLTPKVSTLFILWNACYVINSSQEKQRLRLTLDRTIIEKIPKTETQYQLVDISNKKIKTLTATPNL